MASYGKFLVLHLLLQEGEQLPFAAHRETSLDIFALALASLELQVF